jgi:hypothetical protein
VTANSRILLSGSSLIAECLTEGIYFWESSYSLLRTISAFPTNSGYFLNFSRLNTSIYSLKTSVEVQTSTFFFENEVIKYLTRVAGADQCSDDGIVSITIFSISGGVDFSINIFKGWLRKAIFRCNTIALKQRFLCIINA